MTQVVLIDMKTARLHDTYVWLRGKEFRLAPRGSSARKLLDQLCVRGLARPVDSHLPANVKVRRYEAIENGMRQAKQLLDGVMSAEDKKTALEYIKNLRRFLMVVEKETERHPNEERN